MENKYEEIKLEISLLQDDLEVLEDKDMITAYKTEIAFKTNKLNHLKIIGLIGFCYN